MDNGMAELLQGDAAGRTSLLVRKASLIPMSDTSADQKAASGTTGDASPGIEPTRQVPDDEPSLNETLVPKDQVTLSPSPTTQQRKERDQKTQRAFKISKSVSRKAFEASKVRRLKQNVSSMENPEAINTSTVFAS